MTKPNHSPWSLQIFVVSGIPVRLHFTLLLFFTWIALTGSEQQGAIWPLFLAAIFGCVLLHELGHALVARKYGIKTRDITLYPMGGMATIEGRPSGKEELVIAAAGPAVNLVIALILTPVIMFTEGRFPNPGVALSQFTILDALLFGNLSLAIFNLIPAFPMDGGRILRAILSTRMPLDQATKIAVGIGQSLAIAFGFLGLIRHEPVWMLIAFFVFVAASAELSTTVGRSLLAGHSAQEAMQTRFQTIQSGDTLDTAAKILLEGSQHDFPVVFGDEVLGLLSRTAIVQGLRAHGPAAYVAGHMDREYKQAPPTTPLEEIAEMLSPTNPAPVLVMLNQDLLGMVTTENLSEFIMLEHARTKK